MTDTIWFLLIGAMLVLMALAGSMVKRLPLSMDMVYLCIGISMGPAGLHLLAPDLLTQTAMLERITEIALLFSLFSAGLKLRAFARDSRWRLPIRLAFGVTVLTIAGIALLGFFGLGLSAGEAILLGAVLAPTDPVLASAVQVESAGDRDRVRFGLTGEAGLNDGMAFPFVMLGLGLMGAHELGSWGTRWLAVDLLWGVFAGLGCGWLLGKLVGELVLYLRREHQEAVGLDEFLALGLIALSYGAALLIHAYGFLAVFAAGLALRRIEQMSSGDEAPDAVIGDTPANADANEIAMDPRKAPVYMAKALLSFNEQAERIAEVVIVLLVGAMIGALGLSIQGLLLSAILFLLIRPLAVRVMLYGADAAPMHKRMMAWFGIRGIGSFYYLLYIAGHGVPPEFAQRMAHIVLTVIAASIFAHGISATPLMRLYGRLQQGRAAP